MGDQRALATRSDHGISFPITIATAVIDCRGPPLDVDRSGNFSPLVSPPPPFSSKTQEALPMGPIGLFSNPAVNGLVRQAKTRGTGMIALQPAANLIR